MRCNDYRAEIAIHGARIVLAEEFRTSRTADRTRFGEALGGVKIGHAWVAAEEEAFEILHRGA
jgi:hypothetical protein